MDEATLYNIQYDTGRRPVTAGAFARSELNGDENAYWYSELAAKDGMDPWALVEGVDLHTGLGKDTHCDVWFVSGKCVTVTQDKLIFVRGKDFDKVSSS